MSTSEWMGSVDGGPRAAGAMSDESGTCEPRSVLALVIPRVGAAPWGEYSAGVGPSVADAGGWGVGCGTNL